MGGGRRIDFDRRSRFSIAGPTLLNPASRFTLSRADSDDDSLRFYIGAIGANVYVRYAGACVLSIMYGKSRVCVGRRCARGTGPRVRAHASEIGVHVTTCTDARGCKPVQTFRIGRRHSERSVGGDYRGIITPALYTCDLCLICN